MNPVRTADAVEYKHQNISAAMVELGLPYIHGLGYDALSFDLDGRERYIEVKATALGDGTPFYFTSAELDFAQRYAHRYALYRVYDLDGEPRFFTLEGDITEVLG